MNLDGLSREEMVEYFRPEVQKLIGFLPWLEKQRDAQLYSTYKENGVGTETLAFPVYDSTLLTFVKTMRATDLLDKNYVYVYTKYKIRNEADELRFIKSATIKEMPALWGILSGYILKGMTKATVWSQGVKNGVYLAVISKMREIITFWDVPMTP